MLTASVTPYTLRFAFVARTSRETFTQKRTYFLKITDTDRPGRSGVGEVAVFPSLQPSFDSFDAFERRLAEVAADIDSYATGARPLPEDSAIRFGVESALADLYGTFPLPGDDFAGIPINGLVWMNDIDTMRRQLDDKVAAGFRCVKLKIGAGDFDAEVDLLRSVRQRFPASDLQIRVDANGAFTPENVMSRLERLAPLGLHSIEQPLPRDSDLMAEVCRLSPVPVALDEDMIERWWTDDEMRRWLGAIRPAFIVLKPSLAGGFAVADRWIRVARELGVGWWATSALESGIGLTAIARWLWQYPEALTFPQGLGTGTIYTNSPAGGVTLRGDRLYTT